MLIGVLSQRTGFSRDTIRFYEKHGLIGIPRGARRQNNYKEYPEEILERLLTIKRIKAMGFTLRETAGVLELLDSDSANCNNVAYHIEHKLMAIEARIADLVSHKKLLQAASAICSSTCRMENSLAPCGIVVKDMTSAIVA